MSDLGILVPLWTALQRLIDDIGFLTIVNTSSFNLVVSSNANYRGDEVDWSFIDLCDPFML